MEKPQIIGTRDYSMFKSVGFNREKNRNHIDKLKEIIRKDNQLHLHPILINDKFEVISGQHRLQCAKELSYIIYYIKSDLSYSHILDSNRGQRDLTLKDNITYYALKDNLPAYLLFLERMSMTSLAPKALLGLVFGTTSQFLSERLRNGVFKFPPDEHHTQRVIDSYMGLISYLNDKKITPKSMTSSYHFTPSYRNLVSMGGFDEKVFYSKLDQKWFDLRPQVSSLEWTKLLVGIYNWKNKKPLEIEGE